MMRFRAALLSAAVFAFFSSVHVWAISPDGLRLVQVSTVNALMAGSYDGVAEIKQLLQFGNFGIGTVDAIDGELILYNGVPYVAKSDGTVVIAPNTETVPFASVYRIDRGNLISERFTGPITRDEFLRRVDRLAANPSLFYAVLFEGNFVSVDARSERKQEKPYRSLAETMKDAEVRFHYTDRSGVLIGFRSPGFVGGLNVPGCHLHFISSDRTLGGHAVDFVLASGRISVQPIPNFTVCLPEMLSVAPEELSRDRSAEIETIER